MAVCWWGRAVFPPHEASAFTALGSSAKSCWPMQRFSPKRNNNSIMANNFWLVKQEPQAYSWATFLKEGKTAWTGVGNFQARNKPHAIRKGDRRLYYPS